MRVLKTQSCTVQQEMLTNLHFISIDDLHVDKRLMIWLAFGCLFGFDKLNVDKFRLIHCIRKHYLLSAFPVIQ